MTEDITYCTNDKCTIKTCVRNPKNIKQHGIHHSFAHLEGNPLYCPKKDWNGYQVKEKGNEI